MMDDVREEWRTIPGWEGRYEASSRGRVRSLDREITDRRGQVRRIRGRCIRLVKNKSGYLYVNLHDNARRRFIRLHRCVLEAFKGRAPSSKHVTRHLNGVRTDNRIENLEWGTQKENMEDSVVHGTSNRGDRNGQAKVSRNDVCEIIARYRQGGVTQAQLGEEYGVNHAQINRILSGKRWRWLTELQETENV